MGLKHEETWVEGWNTLYEKVEQEPELLFLAFDWSEMTEDDALGFIQNQAYEGYQVEFEEVWYKGKKSLRFYRGREIS
ncbi:hypothetical protein C1752_00897 [Acaryochloris thomasi RCC1774]|uniref:Uncharacterized protein n=1 Tax=Acaryochloris thomasi RCC1774 TaxID=1764569 RepID=A0A2W1JNS1_9CYAN|nr:hypothetical protein [Acaryochloris thomasi]PZD74939.1 hypothetical protein C1752_00897 [Acaryochloris thomasi RCC1774]